MSNYNLKNQVREESNHNKCASDDKTDESNQLSLMLTKYVSYIFGYPNWCFLFEV